MIKILIIASVFTGHGHKSICDSLCEQFDKMQNIEVLAIDGFDLMGKREGEMVSKTYGVISRNSSNKAWSNMYALGENNKQILEGLIKISCENRFISLIKQFHPDLILTVHSFFNGAMMDILAKYKLPIPFAAHLADLIDIPSSWYDQRLVMTFCPTIESYDYSIARGADPGRLALVGFPVRKSFCDEALKIKERVFDTSKPLEVLMMSGAEGAGDTLENNVSTILENTDVNLNVICGRNKKLCDRISRYKTKYNDRLNVFGFVTDMHAHMSKADLMLMRASPNSMMEAVCIGLPIVITGAMEGQERRNPEVMKSHNLCEICENTTELPGMIKRLQANGCSKLKQISEAQRAYYSPYTAEDTAKKIAALAKPLQYDVKVPKVREVKKLPAGLKKTAPPEK